MTSSDTEQPEPSVDRLRRAAGVVREASAAATPGVWTAHLLPPNEHHKHPGHWVKAKYDDGSTVTSEVVADCPWRQADAAWIALMSPPVGEALAKWLERAAHAHEATLITAGKTWASVMDPRALAFVEHMTDRAALAAADAILAAVSS